MIRQFDLVIGLDAQGYYVVSVPDLPGCRVRTRHLDELIDLSQATITEYLEMEGEPEEALGFAGAQEVCPLL